MRVASEIELPLARRRGPADVEVVQEPVVVEGDEEPFRYMRRGAAVVLVWPGLRFAVGARRVAVDAPRGLEHAVDLLLGPVWSVVLAARGREALHACVVAGEDGAIAVAGESGAGKSTAGRKLVGRGARLVADDLLVLDERWRAVPGPPLLSLCAQGGGKERVAVPASRGPVPLSTLLVLESGEEGLRRLSGVAALEALRRNVYSAIVTQPGQAERRFALLTALAQKVPVYAAPPRSVGGDALERLLSPRP